MGVCRLNLPFQTLKDECKRTVCDCELVYVLGQGGRHIQRQLMAFASLNCSHRGLTEMPSFLPGNTTTLRLTGNKVAIFYFRCELPYREGIVCNI